MLVSMRAELRHGARLFNRGQWWEAHEAWEAEWLRAEGQERRFIQGLILLAAALHKRWHHGSLTERNYHKALVKLSEFPDIYGGIELALLKAEVRRALDEEGVLPQLPLTDPDSA